MSTTMTKEQRLDVDVRQLRAAVAQCLAAAATRSSLPMLQCIKLSRAFGNKIRLEATDLEIMVSVDVPADATAGGPAPVLVNAKQLSDVLKQFTGEIGFYWNHGFVTAGSEGTVIRIRTFPVDDSEWPVAPDDIKANYFHDVQWLLPDTKLVLRMAAKDEFRPSLSCVCWDEDAFTTTDTHRMCRITHVRLPGWPRILVPSCVMQKLSKLLGNDGSPISVGTDGFQLFVRNHSTSIVVRLAEGAYPAFEKVLRSDNDGAFICDNTELAIAVRRLMPIALVDQRRMRLYQEYNKISISVQTSDGEGTVDLVSGDWCGTVTDVWLDGGYLLESLETFPPHSRVMLGLKIPYEDRPSLEAVVVHCYEHPDRRVIQMPMQPSR